MKKIIIVLVIIISCSNTNDFDGVDLILKLDSVEKLDIAKKIFKNSIFEDYSVREERFILKNSLVLFNDSLYFNPDILKNEYKSQFSYRKIEKPVITHLKDGYYIDILGNWTLGIAPPNELDFVSHHFELIKNENLKYYFLFVKEPTNNDKIIINLGTLSNVDSVAE